MFPLLTPSGVVRKVTPRVYVKFLWADSWEYLPYLYPVQASREVAPAMPQADFLWRFGRLRRFGAPVANVAPIDIKDYYVKITGVHADGTEELLWVGVIVDDQVTIKREYRGFQEIKAFGLEHMMDRVPIDHAIVEHDGKRYTIGWAPDFNRLATGQRLMVDAATKKIQGNRAFGFPLRFRSTDTRLWNLRDACRYILKNFTPGGITFELGGQDIILEQFDDEVWQQADLTCKGFMDRYVSRTRGIGWYMGLVDSGTVPIKVFTQTDEDVTVGTKTLARNQNAVPFFLPQTYPNTHLYNIGILRYANTEVVHEIVIQGQRVEVTGTWSIPDGTLERAWTDEQLASYNNLAGAANVQIKDMERADDRHSKVFSAFVVPQTWDGWLGNGINTLLAPVIVETDDNGGVAFQPEPTEDHQGFCLLNKEFQIRLPFMEGIDYTASPPTDNNRVDSKPEYRRMFAIFKDPIDNKFVLADRMDWKRPGRFHQCHIAPEMNEFGVRIEASPRHHIGKGTFTGPSQFGPEIDYRTLIVTASYQSDQRQHILVRNPNEHETNRRLTVTLDEAEYWVASPHTVVGVNGTGDLTYINPDEMVLRNDLPKLQAVAAFMEAYFFQTRQALSITVPYISATPGTSQELGVFITNIVGLQTVEPVKAVVTSQVFDFRNQTTTTKTSYMSLDEMIQAGLTWAARPAQGHRRHEAL